MDWSAPKAYLHDQIATDKRNPTVNANGPIYGATEESTDFFPVLDPVHNKATQIKMPVRDPKTPTSKTNAMMPSPYWGDEPIWDSQTTMHNPMIDERGGGFTARVRPVENPAFCKKGSDHPSAKMFPTERASRHLSFYDPNTKKITLISTCFSTHHLQFGFDANNTLWASAGGGGGGGDVVGWLNTKMFEATGDEQKSQGWTALILDTNGNGKRDEYVEPDQPVDPTKDKRIVAAFYGIAPSPVDDSVWGSVLGYPGYIIRLNPGSNPSETALTEVFEPPFPGYSPRGMDIDGNGVVWAPLASGHLASFDRRKCKVLNGPTATGKHCPRGGRSSVSLTAIQECSRHRVSRSELLHLQISTTRWVWARTYLFATGNANESLIALVNGKFVNFVVPYPMGFYAKGMDGRIDDPKAGWKGKGIWTTHGNRTPFHLEGGKGTLPKVVKFQIRPDPLAK